MSATAVHLLRELVHLSSGWVAHEPRLDLKIALVDHVYDDVRSLAELSRRNPDPAGPGADLVGLLNQASACVSPAEYLEVAYGELKPALAAIAATLAPDEVNIRLLHRQERHLAELPARDYHRAPSVAAADPGPPRTPQVIPAPPAPARDRHVVPVDGHDDACQAVHDLMAAELQAAERATRESHEQPARPLDEHVALAAVAQESMRIVQACERLLSGELGCHWGDHPATTDVPPDQARARAAPYLQDVDWWDAYLAQLTAAGLDG